MTVIEMIDKLTDMFDGGDTVERLDILVVDEEDETRYQWGHNADGE